MIKLVEEYTSNSDYNFNYLLEKYEFPDYEKYKNNEKVLYHNTRPPMVDSISKHGLLCDKATAEIDIAGTIPMIWTTISGGGSGYGGCTVAFENNSEYFEKVNDREIVIYDDIPAKDILFIDTWICEDSSLKRVSDIRRLIRRLGVDRVKNTLYRKYDNGVKFFYDVDFLIQCAE
jgi:hypothetical protein